ncbi:MAG: hypothetical protein ACLFV6_12235 [Spirulinaceae cyanobacterium]
MFAITKKEIEAETPSTFVYNNDSPATIGRILHSYFVPATQGSQLEAWQPLAFLVLSEGWCQPFHWLDQPILDILTAVNER